MLLNTACPDVIICGRKCQNHNDLSDQVSPCYTHKSKHFLATPDWTTFSFMGCLLQMSVRTSTAACLENFSFIAKLFNRKVFLKTFEMQLLNLSDTLRGDGGLSTAETTGRQRNGGEMDKDRKWKVKADRRGENLQTQTMTLSLF